MRIRIGHLVLFVVALLGLLAGCGGGGSGVNAPTIASQEPIAIEGYVQKGPFILGSTVEVYGLLDGSYEQGGSGTSLSLKTENFMGKFSLTDEIFQSNDEDGEIEANFVEIIGTGYYFDETLVSDNPISDSTLTLRTLSKNTKNININILTTLAEDRIKYLLNPVDPLGVHLPPELADYDKALAQAQEEIIRNVFQISTSVLPEGGFSQFDGMDMNVEGTSNDVLLAASLVIQGTVTPAGQVTDLINTIVSDIKTSGTLTDTTSKNHLIENARCLAPTTIRDNILKRYAALGAVAVGAKIPTDFEKYLDSTGDGKVDSLDDVVPTVKETSPINGAESEAAKPLITVEFDKSMDGGSITDATFTVTAEGSTTPIGGTVTYDCTTRTATFTPDDDLSSFTRYTAATLSGIKDVGGNAPASEAWSFTTADVVAPTVVTPTSPASSATGVLIDANVTVTFDEAMAPATLTTGFTLRTTLIFGEPVAGDVTYDADTNTMTFNPTTNLARNTLYTATLTTAVTDAAGNALAENYTWSFTSEPWVLDEVETAGFVGQYTSIGIDGSDNAYISYYDAMGGDLEYATNATGTWVPATVASDGDLGQYSSIAVESDGDAHISYYHGSNNTLQYTTNTTGIWIPATVDDTLLPTGWYTSIDLDTSNNAHISYYADASKDLKYATNAPAGVWDIGNTVDSEGTVGKYTSIAVDGVGTVHIGYYDETNTALKYATGTLALGWGTPVTVDNTASVGTYTSIAVDGTGTVHISYYDETNTALKYATGTAATGFGTPVTVDSAGNVGQYSSIVTDSGGYAYISYYDATNFDLKYATNATGSWVTSTVDSTGTAVGTWTSIDIDSTGRTHISYISTTPANVKYAH